MQFRRTYRRFDPLAAGLLAIGLAGCGNHNNATANRNNISASGTTAGGGAGAGTNGVPGLGRRVAIPHRKRVPDWPDRATGQAPRTAAARGRWEETHRARGTAAVRRRIAARAWGTVARRPAPRAMFPGSASKADAEQTIAASDVTRCKHR